MPHPNAYRGNSIKVREILRGRRIPRQLPKLTASSFAVQMALPSNVQHPDGGISVRVWDNPDTLILIIR